MKRKHFKKLCNNSNDKRQTGHIAHLLLFKFLNDYKLNRIHMFFLKNILRDIFIDFNANRTKEW